MGEILRDIVSYGLLLAIPAVLVVLVWLQHRAEENDLKRFHEPFAALRKPRVMFWGAFAFVMLSPGGAGGAGGALNSCGSLGFGGA